MTNMGAVLMIRCGGMVESQLTTAKPETKRLARWSEEGFMWGGITGALVGIVLLGLLEWVKYIQRFREPTN